MTEKITINEELVKELASKLKTPKDLAAFSKQLLKSTLECALNAEMDAHLGYAKNAITGNNSGNSRNGSNPKTITGDLGDVTIDNPRDRNGTFKPGIIKKHQVKYGDLDKKILALYSGGMTTRDISDAMQELYDVEVSHTLISQVTDAVLDDVTQWRERPLDKLYPIVYLDCIVIKVHQDKRVINKAVYLALGVNSDGMKELLGMWISENEGSKFWLSVLTELQNRGVDDVFIFCVDGLTGFPEAIEAAYPKAKVQVCIVHMVRNSLKYVSHKHKKQVASDLRKIYQSVSITDAEQSLDTFSEKWDKSYPAVSRMWYSNWANIITIFDYPDEIRRAIYSTNSIESLNSVIRKSIRNRKIFPNDNSAFKVIYLTVMKASSKWTMPIRDWQAAMNRFAIDFQGRFPE